LHQWKVGSDAEIGAHAIHGKVVGVGALAIDAELVIIVKRVLRRERTARNFAPELARRLESEWTLAPTVEEEFTENAIKDDLLRMMFSCCHPRLSEEGQVALMLNILCSFSVHEIAGHS